MIPVHRGHTESRREGGQGNSYIEYLDWCYEGEVQALNPHFLKFCPPFKANSKATPPRKPLLIPQPGALSPFCAHGALSALLHSFIYKYLMSIDFIPGTILGTEDTAVNNTDKLCS